MESDEVVPIGWDILISAGYMKEKFVPASCRSLQVFADSLLLLTTSAEKFWQKSHPAFSTFILPLFLVAYMIFCLSVKLCSLTKTAFEYDGLRTVQHLGNTGGHWLLCQAVTLHIISSPLVKLASRAVSSELACSLSWLASVALVMDFPPVSWLSFLQVNPVLVKTLSRGIKTNFSQQLADKKIHWSVSLDLIQWEDKKTMSVQLHASHH